ncbi:uncharacterized protein LOC100168324 [Acyrthosiphon pisum]|uniref:BRCT domain-containing protein n=1 Tax=Acyrthosiphon pisum TaxID=7029 RepID=A0A8R2A718_ACYPI|nr:uncharacterized protein LOC100168324 [Acyrthosiphon pisum]XP_003245640.1 uncharacterized protein LOC100168324 [Acyrthosiphon pisum]XP_008184717.1 uncharacterized protein LOC100168324 [Acyrthosiphon pisum]XP_016661287.1 uncharacterized protein LOC100168324 [Acyrthosiphon pisum]|eukprot:XP_001943815.2 PREDICTED: uncharacterized protein LOC100168324 [Acyrthosiphon pisum]
MSWKDKYINYYQQITTNTSNGGSKSDDNAVNGTPDRYHLSNPENHSERNRCIVITYSNVENDDLRLLQELIDVFDLYAYISWNDRVTHLIVKTLPSGRCNRTKKFMNALLLNRFIITMDWVKNCLSSKTLLPEADYMPLEFSGEPSPLVSWRVGRGIIASPMEWTGDCILYLHRSIELNESYRDIIIWARRAGFVLTNDLQEFNNEYKLRIILVDTIASCTDVQSYLPNATEIISWICNYKGVTIFLDWFLECLFRYKFVLINHYYQIMKLNPKIVEFVNMDESLFEFENC